MKKPRPGGGVFGIATMTKLYLARANIPGPRMGAFFEIGAHDFVIIGK